MRGMTIFSGFSPLEGIIGRSIYELKDEYTALPDKLKKLYKGHVQALEALEQRLAAGEVEEEEEKKTIEKNIEVKEDLEEEEVKEEEEKRNKILKD